MPFEIVEPPYRLWDVSDETFARLGLDGYGDGSVPSEPPTRRAGLSTRMRAWLVRYLNAHAFLAIFAAWGFVALVTWLADQAG